MASYIQNSGTLSDVPRDSLEKVEAEMDAEIAAEAPPSPVRRRTVTEIVPGTYGALDVNSVYGVIVGVTFNTLALNATELRAAASTLTALADALDEIGAQK